MSEKDNAKFSLGILCVILLIFIFADFFKEDSFFSEVSRHLLRSRPEISVESAFSKDFQEKYNEALTDQFPGRDKLMVMRTGLDLLAGKEEQDGIYVCSGGYLMAVHHPDAYPPTLIEEKVGMLKDFTEDNPAFVMLVPTPDNVLSEKLPFCAPYFDETALLEKVEETVGANRFVDVLTPLMEHKEEGLYFKTDSHWNSRGAYYAYLAWAKQKSVGAYEYNLKNMVTVVRNFRGDLYERFPLSQAVDAIDVFSGTLNERVNVTYDDAKTAVSMYEETFLEGENGYGYFLDNHHGLTRIDTIHKNNRTMILVKGSYGNVFAPLLMHHYETIYVVDPAYCENGLAEALGELEKGGQTDILVLYDCIEFLEDFEYRK